MDATTPYLADTAPVQRVLEYLRDQHGVSAVVVNSQGRTVPLGDGPKGAPFPHERVYPFTFAHDAGGIHCSAATPASLDKADPHIRMCVELLSGMLEQALVLQQTTDEMLRLSEQLHFLVGLANKVTGLHDLKDYATVILREVSQAISADSAFVYTEGKGAEKLNRVAYNMTEQHAVRIRQTAAFEAADTRRTIVFTLEDGSSVLVTPIKEKDHQIGYMAFFRHQEKQVFTAYEKQFLTIIDNIISPTMESLKLYDSLHELYLNTVKALAAAIDAKDEYTHGHSFRVAKYAVAIAREMNITGDQLTDLEVAAYMHDLGKIGVPEKILGKPGKLTDEEFDEIKKHPVLTHKILEPIDLPDHIVNAAVQHHERLDGRGYPQGLTGEKIAMFAKIIAVADVFDALTSARPYRDSMTVEDALTILYKGIDKEFDRDVVLALISALRDEQQDEALAKIYPTLKFINVDQMNTFLVQLTQHLLPGRRSEQPVTPAPPPRPADQSRGRARAGL
ncbi:MAG: HD domain-containing protein [Deltaproteobacteria bacterium]|nr:HD domain-containing protein [Deltaproteobacteria bacterium]